MSRQAFMIIGLVALGLAGAWGILRSAPAADVGHEHEDEGGHAGEAAERGPHGGRMLRDGDFAVELQIVESGRPPAFQLFAYRDGKPLPADGLAATIELTRLGGRVERFDLVARGDRLESKVAIAEPHSFDVRLAVRTGNGAHQWAYPSYENRVEIGTATAAGAGITVAQAGPARIRETLLLYGSIIPDERRVRSVTARFPGVVREVCCNLGDKVAAGATLALVESNESLETYPVRSPIAGLVLSRSANPGEHAGEQPLFTIGDLSRVWAELAVFRRDLRRVSTGQAVRVRSDDGGVEAAGEVGFISPVGSGESQSVRIRVSLDNRDGRWQPGMFVTGEVTTMEADVPVAVARPGLQTLGDADVVFARVGDFYEPRMLELGRGDREHVEIVAGITTGDEYVVGNSFLVKAEIGKAGAAHEH